MGIFWISLEPYCVGLKGKSINQADLLLNSSAGFLLMSFTEGSSLTPKTQMVVKLRMMKTMMMKMMQMILKMMQVMKISRVKKERMMKGILRMILLPMVMEVAMMRMTMMMMVMRMTRTMEERKKMRKMRMKRFNSHLLRRGNEITGRFLFFFFFIFVLFPFWGREGGRVQLVYLHSLGNLPSLS